jgi:hypothetical protein
VDTNGSTLRVASVIDGVRENIETGAQEPFEMVMECDPRRASETIRSDVCKHER